MQGINVIEENKLTTSISYPYDTYPPKLTHQKPGHRDTSARSIVSEEKALYFAELIAPAHTSRAIRLLIYPFIPRGGSFQGAFPRSNFCPSSCRALCFITRHRAFLVKCLARLNYVPCDSLPYSSRRSL